MASLKDIRRRIQSVKSTRQITRAMKLVAAAKMRRAQENIVNARPYAYRIYSILHSLAKQGATHSLLETRPEKQIQIIVLAGDRGLCGAFNTNIFKATESVVREKQQAGIEVSVACIGKKAFDYFKSRFESPKHYEGLLAKSSYRDVSAVASQLLDDYKAEQFDAAYLVYNEFKSAIQQQVVVEKFIPIGVELPAEVLRLTNMEEASVGSTIYEPDKQNILEALVPRHFKVQLFRAVLESLASEHGARMSAMESATKNASEMIDRLTLDYNKARQAGITKELMEIVGGVEAMR